MNNHRGKGSLLWMTGVSPTQTVQIHNHTWTNSERIRWISRVASVRRSTNNTSLGGSFALLLTDSRESFFCMFPEQSFNFVRPVIPRRCLTAPATGPTGHNIESITRSHCRIHNVPSKCMWSQPNHSTSLTHRAHNVRHEATGAQRRLSLPRKKPWAIVGTPPPW